MRIRGRGLGRLSLWEGALRDDSKAPRASTLAGQVELPKRQDTAMVKSRPGLLDRIRATAAGRITLKVVVAVVGVTIMLLGVVMIPLPGPGWLVVFAGLAILSVEYVWAKHLLSYTREKVRAWTLWVARQPLPVRLVIGAAGLAFVAGLIWLGLRSAAGAELTRDIWRFLTSD